MDSRPVAPSAQPPLGKRVSLPIGDRRVEELLLWRDPAKTGVVFGVITLIYILLEWSHFNILTLFSNLLLVIVSVTFVWNNIATFTNRSGVPVPKVLRDGLGEREIRNFAEQATPAINKVLGFGARIATGKDVVLSGEVALALFLFAKIARYFTFLGLFYTIVLVSFTLPKIYEVKKDDIDRLLKLVHNQILELYTKFVKPYLKKIPKAKGSQGTYRVDTPAAPAAAPTGATSTSPMGSHPNLLPQEPKKAI